MRPDGRATRVLVGQVADKDNWNAQVQNARHLLACMQSTNWQWQMPYYHLPDPRLAARTDIKLVRLWRSHAWKLAKFCFYLRGAELIFYPGFYAFDEWGLRVRRMLGRRVPVVAILEGLVGDEEREERLAKIAAHPVRCQRIPPALRARVDRLYERADRIVAISPFLARMGEELYGKPCETVPLGIDQQCFYPSATSGQEVSITVVGAGRLYANKRPELFVSMARSMPDVKFVWYGEGELRENLLREVQSGVPNLDFPGALPPDALAAAFRRASLFVLPSQSEGAPKVVQEAVACGLPVVLYGHYESPAVVPNRNGYVVWNDEELVLRVRELTSEAPLRASMAAAACAISKQWGWADVAPRWQAVLQTAVHKT